MNKKTAILIFILLIGFCSLAQTPIIDSLKKLLQATNAPAHRAELLIALLKENESLDASTVLNYDDQLYTLSNSLKDDKLKWRAVYFKIVYYEKVAQLEEAASLGDSAIKALRISPLKKELYPMFANTQSFVLTKQNKFKEALSLNFTVLQYAENINDTLYQMRIKNGIGLIYMEMGQNREAINWFLSSLHTTTNPEYLRKAIPVYSNLAANYNDLHLNDSAFYYIRKSLSLANAAQNFDYLANAYFI